jgi:hypothetical protein
MVRRIGRLSAQLAHLLLQDRQTIGVLGEQEIELSAICAAHTAAHRVQRRDHVSLERDEVVESVDGSGAWRCLHDSSSR